MATVAVGDETEMNELQDLSGLGVQAEDFHEDDENDRRSLVRASMTPSERQDRSNSQHRQSKSKIFKTRDIRVDITT